MRKSSRLVNRDALLLLLPASRRQIMDQMGWTTVAHDQALGNALQALKREGVVEMVREVSDSLEVVPVWRVVA
jgi:hypothetical protein